MSTISDLRAKIAAATPLPWPEDYVYEAMRHIARNCEIESTTDPEFDWDRYNDSPLVTAALNALPALLDVAEAAQRVDQEWIERGDGGCSTNLRLDLHVALGKLPQKSED